MVGGLLMQKREAHPRFRTAGLCCLAALTCAALYGGQSLVLTNIALTVNRLPNTSTYSAIANWRIEGQADNWVNHNAAVGLWEIDSACAVTIKADNTLYMFGWGNETIGIPLGSTTAFRFVAQRNTATGKYTLEIWDAQTGAYTEAEAPIAASRSLNMSNTRFSIGSFYEGTEPDIHLGFLRWYSSNRPVRGAPPAMTTNAPGDLLDFEFEGNLNDASPARSSVSIATGLQYAATATFPPAINLAGVPTTVRAAHRATLDATASFSNTDSTQLSCVWAQVSSPVRGGGRWSVQNTCTTTFTPMISGTYTLRLTLLDSLQQQKTQDIVFRAVATDDNDVVIVPNSPMAALIGPLIRDGANPWPWLDDRNKRFADLMISSLDKLWPQPWNTPSNGTIVATRDSAVITGQGTHFLTDACPSSGNQAIVIWYNSFDYPGETGRALFGINSCQDDTHLTLMKPYAFNVSGNTSPMSYALVNYNDLAPWKGLFGGSAMGRITFNYYDGGLAMYALYYRTGDQRYLTAARQIEDMWWTCPYVDRGQAFVYPQGGGGFFNPESRTAAPLGLLARAIDGRPEMFTGLKHLWDLKTFQLDGPTRGLASDHREEGFSLAALGACALVDPVNGSSCRATLRNVADYTLTPLMGGGSAFHNVYGIIFAQGASFPSSGGWGGGTLFKVVDGSPIVTLASGSSITPYICGSAHSCNGVFSIIFGPFTTAPPSSNAGFDSRGYNYNVTSDTTLTLTENYNSGGQCPAPNGCTRGWSIYTVFGYGIISYMTGDFLLGIDLARQAFVSSGEDTYSSAYQSWEQNVVTYITTVAYNPNWLGTYSDRGFTNCEPPGSDTPAGSQGNCFGDIGSARQNNGEIMAGLTRAYLANPSPSLQSFGDTLVSSMFSKAGTGGLPPSDSNYVTGLDEGGYMIAQTAGVLNGFEENKWFGFFFGIGNVGGWPAVRRGAIPPELQTQSLSFDLNSVKGASQARITVMQPSGATTQTTCSSSPCRVTVDARQGDHLIRLDYLSASGSVVSPGSYTPLPVTR